MTTDELWYASRGDITHLRLEDEPSVTVSRDTIASVNSLWELVSNLDTPAKFSTEFLGGTWRGQPAVGVAFSGRNQHPAIGEWEVDSFASVWEPPFRFGWVTIRPQNPGSTWLFTITDHGDHRSLSYFLSIGPGPSGITGVLTRMPEREHDIIVYRLGEHRDNMIRTVEGIIALAEGS